MIAQATERYGPGIAEAPAEPTVEFSVGDVEDIPYVDEHFDVVIALGLFEYLDDVDSATDSLLQVTKPGGTVVVSVPNAICADALTCRVFSPLVTTAARAARKVIGTVSSPGNFFHRKFRPGKLDRLFASCGAEKSGQSFYNLEMAFYPLRRLLPGPSLWLKERAEPHHEGPLRLFATAYIGRYTKHRAKTA
jgi:SAM-dependent methyltransferase